MNLIEDVIDFTEQVSPDSTESIIKELTPTTTIDEKMHTWFIYGNKERLSQVFNNLIDNALSFNKDNKKIEIFLKSNKKNVFIEISDYGPGIHVNNFNKVFDRFFTERPTGEKFGEHSGLGLSIAKQILDIHKGLVTVENRLNKNKKIIGAKFIITLKKVI